MSYWKSKVLPRLQKILPKKRDCCHSEEAKTFDASIKDTIAKEIEEKKIDFQPKVAEIYKSSPLKAQVLLKEPSKGAIKENPEVIQTLLKLLASAGIPGAEFLSEASTKHGVSCLSTQIIFLLNNVKVLVGSQESVEKEAHAGGNDTREASELASAECDETPAEPTPELKLAHLEIEEEEEGKAKKDEAAPPKDAPKDA